MRSSEEGENGLLHNPLRNAFLTRTVRSHLMSAQRGWIKVRTQFRPRVRTCLRTFSVGEKCEKKPSPSSSAKSWTPAEDEEDADELCPGRKY